MTDTNGVALPAAGARQRGRATRSEWHWLLGFARMWYVTQSLKRHRVREQWTDRLYYRMVFAAPNHDGAAERDKFASTRAKVTRGIAKHPEARVLDLGTGLGFQARSIWDSGYRNVFACDLIPDRIALARRLHAGTAINFMTGDMQALGFPDRSLDAITVSVALHDLPRVGIAAALTECDRALKAGGRVVLLEPRYERDLSNALHRWAYRTCGRLLDESVHVEEFVRFDLAGWLAHRGYVELGREVLWHSVLCLYTFEKSA